MSGNTAATTDASTETESTVTTECGHTPAKADAISVPGVGYLCRTCHTPIPLSQWESVIDKRSQRLRTGETVHKRTWLVGLDACGRGIYHDTGENVLRTLVPKYHRAFEPDVDGDERPVRTTPPRHGGSRGRIVESPDNGVLVEVARDPLDGHHYRRRDLVELVADRALEEDWTALSAAMVDGLQADLTSYRRGGRHGAYPETAVETVLNEYSEEYTGE